MLKRLKLFGASLENLIDVYTKKIRSILEFGVPVWNPNLAKHSFKLLYWELNRSITRLIAFGSNPIDLFWES